MSLTKPHAIWWTAGSNPYEVSKAIIQCKMLSGRYRTLKLSSNWSESGNSCCPAPYCTLAEESLEHILLHCPAYAPSRSNIVRKAMSAQNPAISNLVTNALSKPSEYLVQFLLDPTVLPETMSLVQVYGEDILFTVFSITRSWCYSVHRDRLKLIEVLKSS